MASEDILFFFIIYSVGLCILLHVSMTLRLAGYATPTHGKRTAKYLIAGLWLWALAANAYALVVGESFLWLVPSLVIPLAIGVGITFLPKVKDLLCNASLARVVGVQVYRIAGAVFLVSYFYFDGEMSREFAQRAGWGDVLTGVLALPIALAVAKQMRSWALLVVAWCLLGIGDLILAPVTAQLYGGPPTDGFPINTIPIFWGPPLGILLHVVALRILWLQRRRKRSVA